MTQIVSAPAAIRKLLRDAADRPVGVQDYAASECRALVIDCEGKRFDASWSPGFFAEPAGLAQLETLLATRLPALLARLYGERLAPGETERAVGLVRGILQRVDADVFPEVARVELPRDTPLHTAQRVWLAMEMTLGAALQRGASQAIAEALGRLRVIEPVTPSLPTPAEHHQQIAETFESQTAADAGAVP